jgi:hypothetical protein
MRFLLPAVAFLTLGLRTGSVEPTPRPIVILVHGRGLIDADTASLRREWKLDLDSGLATVGLPKLPDNEVRLAWYADVFDATSPGRCDAPKAADDSLGIGSLLQGFLGTLAAAMPREDAPGARALLADVLYIIDPATRCAAERRVGRVVEAALAEKRPVVIVAYSLGSVVAYDYLNSRKADVTRADVRLVTLGSPLGNPELRGLLAGTDTLRVPPGVSAWDNVYDPDDIFAAPIGGPGRVVRDRVTQSAAAFDAHHIGRYLRDRETATAVGRALCASAPSLDEACRRLTETVTK